MATTPQGIMALPEGGQEQAAPQLGLDDSYDAIRTGLAEASPDQSMQVQQQLNAILPALDQLTDEQLDGLIEIVQYMHDHEEEYPQLVAQLVRDDIVDEGVFPEEYSPEVIATLGMVLLEAKRQRRSSAPQMPQPPVGMARGGIAEAARMVASSGRNGDTMLAHINPKEAALLKRRGGSGTINPKTGLPEYWGLGNITRAITGAVSSVAGAVKSVVNGVVSTVKDFAKSTVGKVLITAALATFLGPGAFGVAGMGLGAGASLGLASAGASFLGGSNLKEALTAGAKGFFLGSVGAMAAAPLGAATGVTSAAGQAALGAGAAGTGLGLLTGQSLKDSVKSGLTAATIAGLSTGAAKGFDTPAEVGQVKVNQQTGEVTTGGAEAGNNPQGPVTAAGGTTPQNQIDLNNRVAVSPDPLGDFIQKNEAFRTAAATPIPPAPTPEKGWWDSTKEFLSPTSRAQTGAEEAGKAYDDAYKKAIQSGRSVDAATIAANNAASAAKPGVFSTYGPAIAAGLGVTALAGGFKPKDPPQMSPQMSNAMSGQATRDLMAANPKDYLVQNLPGVQYDTRGNIVGSTPWTPRQAGQTEIASSDYIPFSLPNTYNAPANSAGSRMVNQPYNTNMYSNLMGPQYAAAGGFMQSPLSMDPGPSMAMQSQQMPMNTPGVPMNMPMGMGIPRGYAAGGAPAMGIASLAPGGYPRRTGQISGPGTETSDDIPAMLSDGEFVMTAKAVKALGNGNRRAGAKKMYALMHRLEKNAARG